MTRTQPRPPVVLYMMSAFQFSLQPNYIICGLRSKRVVACPDGGSVLAILLASTKDTFQVGYLGFNRRLFSSGISWLQPKTFQGQNLCFSRRLFSRGTSWLQPKTLFKEEIVASKKTSSVASAE